MELGLLIVAVGVLSLVILVLGFHLQLVRIDRDTFRDMYKCSSNYATQLEKLNAGLMGEDLLWMLKKKASEARATASSDKEL
jgi:hypothetical protein